MRAGASARLGACWAHQVWFLHAGLGEGAERTVLRGGSAQGAGVVRRPSHAGSPQPGVTEHMHPCPEAPHRPSHSRVTHAVLRGRLPLPAGFHSTTVFAETYPSASASALSFSGLRLAFTASAPLDAARPLPGCAAGDTSCSLIVMVTMTLTSTVVLPNTTAAAAAQLSAGGTSSSTTATISGATSNGGADAGSLAAVAAAAHSYGSLRFQVVRRDGGGAAFEWRLAAPRSSGRTTSQIMMYAVPIHSRDDVVLVSARNEPGYSSLGAILAFNVIVRYALPAPPSPAPSSLDTGAGAGAGGGGVAPGAQQEHHQRVQVALLVGTVVGGGVALAALGVLVFMFVRRVRRRRLRYIQPEKPETGHPTRMGLVFGGSGDGAMGCGDGSDTCGAAGGGSGAGSKAGGSSEAWDAVCGKLTAEAAVASGVAGAVGVVAGAEVQGHQSLSSLAILPVVFGGAALGRQQHRRDIPAVLKSGGAAAPTGHVPAAAHGKQAGSRPMTICSASGTGSGQCGVQPSTPLRSPLWCFGGAPSASLAGPAFAGAGCGSWRCSGGGSRRAVRPELSGSRTGETVVADEVPAAAPQRCLPSMSSLMSRRVGTTVAAAKGPAPQTQMTGPQPALAAVGLIVDAPEASPHAMATATAQAQEHARAEQAAGLLEAVILTADGDPVEGLGHHAPTTLPLEPQPHRAATASGSSADTCAAPSLVEPAPGPSSRAAYDRACTIAAMLDSAAPASHASAAAGSGATLSLSGGREGTAAGPLAPSVSHVQCNAALAAPATRCASDVVVGTTPRALPLSSCADASACGPPAAHSAVAPTSVDDRFSASLQGLDLRALHLQESSFASTSVGGGSCAAVAATSAMGTQAVALMLARAPGSSSSSSRQPQRCSSPGSSLPVPVYGAAIGNCAEVAPGSPALRTRCGSPSSLGGMTSGPADGEAHRTGCTTKIGQQVRVAAATAAVAGAAAAAATSSPRVRAAFVASELCRTDGPGRTAAATAAAATSEAPGGPQLQPPRLTCLPGRAVDTHAPSPAEAPADAGAGAASAGDAAGSGAGDARAERLDRQAGEGAGDDASEAGPEEGERTSAGSGTSSFHTATGGWSPASGSQLAVVDEAPVTSADCTAAPAAPRAGVGAGVDAAAAAAEVTSASPEAQAALRQGPVAPAAAVPAHRSSGPGLPLPPPAMTAAGSAAGTHVLFTGPVNFPSLAAQQYQHPHPYPHSHAAHLQQLLARQQQQWAGPGGGQPLPPIPSSQIAPGGGTEAAASMRAGAPGAGTSGPAGSRPAPPVRRASAAGAYAFMASALGQAVAAVMGGGSGKSSGATTPRGPAAGAPMAIDSPAAAVGGGTTGVSSQFERSGSHQNLVLPLEPGRGPDAAAAAAAAAALGRHNPAAAAGGGSGCASGRVSGCGGVGPAGFGSGPNPATHNAHPNVAPSDAWFRSLNGSMGILGGAQLWPAAGAAGQAVLPAPPSAAAAATAGPPPPIMLNGAGPGSAGVAGMPAMASPGSAGGYSMYGMYGYYALGAGSAGGSSCSASLPAGGPGSTASNAGGYNSGSVWGGAGGGGAGAGVYGGAGLGAGVVGSGWEGGDERANNPLLQVGAWAWACVWGGGVGGGAGGGAWAWAWASRALHPPP